MDANSPPQSFADHLWSVIVEEMDEIAAREPFLRPAISHLTSMREGFDVALAEHLAHDLADLTHAQDSVAEALLSAFTRHPGILDATARDMLAIRSRDPASRSHANTFLNHRGFKAAQVARAAHALWHRARPEAASWLSNRAATVFGPDIHPAARLGSGLMLDHGAAS